jgi:hypothetical protein
LAIEERKDAHYDQKSALEFIKIKNISNKLSQFTQVISEAGSINLTYQIQTINCRIKSCSGKQTSDETHHQLSYLFHKKSLDAINQKMKKSEHKLDN